MLIYIEVKKTEHISRGKDYVKLHWNSSSLSRLYVFRANKNDCFAHIVLNV